MEILHSGEWGTICDDSFEQNNNGASVLCRMMGYPSGEYSTSYRQAGVQKSDRIWLDDVRCTGAESHIKDCIRNEWGANDCGHSEDVAIKCFNMGKNLFYINNFSGI